MRGWVGNLFGVMSSIHRNWNFSSTKLLFFPFFLSPKNYSHFSISSVLREVKFERSQRRGRREFNCEWVDILTWLIISNLFSLNFTILNVCRWEKFPLRLQSSEFSSSFNFVGLSSDSVESDDKNMSGNMSNILSQNLLKFFLNNSKVKFIFNQAKFSIVWIRFFAMTKKTEISSADDCIVWGDCRIFRVIIIHRLLTEKIELIKN